jgi:hypothetical protein
LIVSVQSFAAIAVTSEYVGIASVPSAERSANFEPSAEALREYRVFSLMSARSSIAVFGRRTVLRLFQAVTPSPILIYLLV